MTETLFSCEEGTKISVELASMRGQDSGPGLSLSPCTWKYQGKVDVSNTSESDVTFNGSKKAQWFAKHVEDVDGLGSLLKSSVLVYPNKLGHFITKLG